MKIDIETFGLELDTELKHFVMCCAAFELGPQKRQIESVQIHLAHAPEVRDGKHKHCVAEVEFLDGHFLHTRETDLDLHIAVYHALERLGEMCTQRLSGEDPTADGLPQFQPQLASRGAWERAPIE